MRHAVRQRELRIGVVLLCVAVIARAFAVHCRGKEQSLVERQHFFLRVEREEFVEPLRLVDELLHRQTNVRDAGEDTATDAVDVVDLPASLTEAARRRCREGAGDEAMRQRPSEVRVDDVRFGHYKRPRVGVDLLDVDIRRRRDSCLVVIGVNSPVECKIESLSLR